MGNLFVNFASAALLYTYVGYPILLALWTLLKPITHACRIGLKPTPPQRLSVIIAACNSESHIEAKLRNTETMALSAGCPVQIIVCSDGSTDKTDEIVRNFAAARADSTKVSSSNDVTIELVRLEPRAGKERAQIRAVASASGDVIMFTDARTMLEPLSLQNLRAYFTNPAIGAVSSVDVVPISGEGLYVRYEMWLRKLETSAHSLVGLSGSCFAVRSDLAKLIEPDVPSDFCLMLHSQRRGVKGISAPDVRCSYGVTDSASKEFQRKVRTVLRGLTALNRHRDLMNLGHYGFFAAQLISHKLCRWLAPIFLFFLYWGSLLTCNQSWFSALLAVAGTAVLAAATVGVFVPLLARQLWVRIPTFFVVSNFAILTAWYFLITGRKMETWEPSKA